MSNISFEELLESSRNLADRRGLPTSYPFISKTWGSREVHGIILGSLYGQVSITPQDTDRVSLAGYGDEHVLNRLQANVHSNALHIKSELPFKADQPRRFGRRSFGSFGNNVVISGSSVSIGVGNFSMSSGRQSALIIDSQEVDLSRYIQLAIIVPVGTHVQIGDMIGAVGVGRHLQGVLDYRARFNTNVFAYDATELTGDLSGQSHVEVQRVIEAADIEVSGQGGFVLGSVGGQINASVSGQGSIRISGGDSQSMRADVSGQGSITHNGAVLGGARLRVSGMGDINVSRVMGNLDAKVSGMGNIVANGQRYTQRW